MLNQKNLARSTFERILTLRFYWSQRGLSNLTQSRTRTNVNCAPRGQTHKECIIVFSTTDEMTRHPNSTSKNMSKVQGEPAKNSKWREKASVVAVQKFNHTVLYHIACLAVINDEGPCSLHAHSRSVRLHLCVCAIALTNASWSWVPSHHQLSPDKNASRMPID